MNVRENANLLSDEKKQAYVAAVLKLKNEGNPTTGRNYDTYVQWHRDSIFTDGFNEFGFWSYSHGCPGFLPWHRKFLQLFEQDLQKVSGDSNMTIPYWDWPTDRADSPIWADDFLGGNGVEAEGWKVMDGPFAFDNGNWTLNVRNDAVEPDGALRRALGRDGIPLPTVDQVKDAYSITPYDSNPWNGTVTFSVSFRNYLERLHGPPHPWVGGNGTGSMANVFTSPNDPVFFLHHANVDRIWAKWQRQHAELDYVPVTAIDGVSGSGKNEIMPPPEFGVTVSNVLDLSAEYVYDGKASDDPAELPLVADREEFERLAFRFV